MIPSIQQAASQSPPPPPPGAVLHKLQCFCEDENSPEGAPGQR